MKKLSNDSVYNNLTLKIYNTLVLYISNKFIWKCDTKTVLLPFFKEKLTKEHLDIGVGSGYYLEKINTRVSVCDSNKNSLNFAKKNGLINEIILNDVRHRFKTDLHNKFSSISCFYLFHCIEGSFKKNGIIFDNINELLKSDGIVYGATILSPAKKNLLARALNYTYNRIGVFFNEDDDITSLHSILNEKFTEVKVHKIGEVALFSAKKR